MWNFVIGLSVGTSCGIIGIGLFCGYKISMLLRMLRDRDELIHDMHQSANYNMGSYPSKRVRDVLEDRY